MGVYNTFSFGDGTTYGQSTALQFDVEPFTAVATSFTSAKISWSVPNGSFSAFRLIRNQEGFSEHYEDGVILFTDSAATGIRGNYTDFDGLQPLISGEHAFYSIWILMNDFTWRVIGNTSCLIPRGHGEFAPDGTELVSSASKFASIVPRTYLSTNQTYLDEIDTTSDLYQFLSGMSLLQDETYTRLENLSGKEPGTSSNKELAVLEASSIGLPELTNAGMLTLKRLIRQAPSNYSTKGTPAALKSFSSAVTGYGVEVSTSNNLMLSMQDGTFYKGIGLWQTVGEGTTLVAEEGTIRQSGSPWAIDNTWYGKVTAANSGDSITMGYEQPTLTGIPVVPGDLYVVFHDINLVSVEAGTEGSWQVFLTWFDRFGNPVGDEEYISGDSYTVPSGWVNSGWQRDPLQAPEATYNEDGDLLTEPAMFMGIRIGNFAPGVYHIDRVSVTNTSNDNYPDYYEARAAEVYLYPNKLNYIHNPSFKEVDGSGDPVGWADITSADLVSEQIPNVDNGGTVLESTGAGSTINHAVAPGEYYTLSAYVRNTVSANVDVILSFGWGGVVGVADLIESEPITIGATWQRVSLRVYLPESITPFHQSETGGITFQVAAVGMVEDPIRIGAFQLERGSVATEYFDGDMNLNGAFYSGDNETTVSVDESISHLYYNFATKTNLLQASIATQLPINTPFIVTYGENSLGDYEYIVPALGHTPFTIEGMTKRSLRSVAFSGITS